MNNCSEQIIAYIDGGSRGNPGPAASAFVLTDPDGRHLRAKGIFIGRATNNVAEYTALISALEAAIELKANRIEIFSDSELLVRQVNGRYKVKSKNIVPLFRRATTLLKEFDRWQINHVMREENGEADALVNKALDTASDVEIKPEQKTKNRKPVKLAVLISGGGTTLINILEYIKKGELNAEVVLVISSLSTVVGIERAKAAGLDVKIIRKKDFPDIDEFSTQIKQELNTANVDLVVQAGWLCLWKIPQKYINRVMNIHPALLPSFGGQGMWGHYVHDAVLKAGCKISGCTVHFCTNEYDKGPIIVQRSCPVKEDDTPEILAARVFEQECIAYPQAIKLFAEKRIVAEKGKVRIK